MRAMRNLEHIWPRIADLAADLRLPYQTVAAWGARGIPPRRYPAIIAAAKGRGAELTFEYLVRVASGPAEPAPETQPQPPTEDAA